MKTIPGVETISVAADRERSLSYVGCHASIRLDVTCLGKWSPAQVAALFDGLAKVLSATGKEEAAE